MSLATNAQGIMEGLLFECVGTNLAAILVSELACVCRLRLSSLYFCWNRPDGQVVHGQRPPAVIVA